MQSNISQATFEPRPSGRSALLPAGLRVGATAAVLCRRSGCGSCHGLCPSPFGCRCRCRCRTCKVTHDEYLFCLRVPRGASSVRGGKARNPRGAPVQRATRRWQCARAHPPTMCGGARRRALGLWCPFAADDGAWSVCGSVRVGQLVSERWGLAAAESSQALKLQTGIV